MRIGILGTGLIGTSIALGLDDAGWEVTGWDPDPGNLEAAVRRGAMAPAADRGDLLDPARRDLVVLAGPPSAVIAELETIDAGDLLLIDVTG